MRTTFIVRNIPESALANVRALCAADAYAKLHKWAIGDLRHCVSVKHGTGQFRDRVEWNQVMRLVNGGARELVFTIEPRRGYQLITFSLSMEARA